MLELCVDISKFIRDKIAWEISRKYVWVCVCERVCLQVCVCMCVLSSVHLKYKSVVIDTKRSQIL